MSEDRPSGSWFSEENILLGEVRRAVQVAAPPPVIPGYSNLVELKSGGQGVVYSATQDSTHRRVAIKLLRADGEQSRQRFAREIDLAASLKHPNIIRVYDSGITTDRRVFLVMELIEGPSLERFCVDKSPRQIASLMAHVAEAVGHAHRRGVIHRDLKPENIVIDGDAAPRVLDFGLARVASAQGVEVTTTGQFVGSLAYASPEHCAEDRAGHHAIDTRSDVYSLGVTLYKLLTRAYPYDVTGGLKQTLDNITTAEPVPPRDKNAAIDEDLQTIVLTCLRKEPDRRYGSATELAVDLRSYLAGEPIMATRETAWRSLNRRVKRHRATVLLGAAALTVVAALALWAFAEANRAKRSGEETARALVEAKAAKETAEQATVATTKALNETKAAQDLAERREKQARITAQFLATMLRAADPNRLKKEELGGGNRDVRVVDVLERAARTIPEKFADDHVMAASLHGVIGQTYRSLGKIDDAEKQFAAALTHAEQTGDETILCDALQQQGQLIGNTRGKNAEAEPLMRRVVELRRKLKGDDDQQTIEAVDSLATQLIGQGKFAEAEVMVKDCLDRRLRLRGKNHGDTITSLNNYGTFLRSQGRFEEALVQMRQAAEAADVTLGSEHPAALIAWGNVGNTMVKLDRVADAIPILERVVAGQRKVNGPAHQHTAGALNHLGYAYQNAKPPRYDDALAAYRDGVHAATQSLGKDARVTIALRNNLGTCLMDMKRHDEAVAELRACVEAIARVRGEDHYDTHSMRGNLGQALTFAGKYDEAERLLLGAFDGLKRAYSDQHPEVRETATKLVALYEKLGKPDEAEAWRARSKPGTR